MQPRNPTDNFMTTELQTIFTIGVYGSTEESFFGALAEHEIEKNVIDNETLLKLRQYTRNGIKAITN